MDELVISNIPSSYPRINFQSLGLRVACKRAKRVSSINLFHSWTSFYLCPTARTVTPGGSLEGACIHHGALLYTTIILSM